MKSSALLVTMLGASVSVNFAWAQGAPAVLDARMARQSGCVACALRIDSGSGAESRTGGSELPNEMPALFALEDAVLLDNGRADQAGRLFGLEALIGVQRRGGMRTFGRQHNVDDLALADVGDPFTGAMAGSAANLVGHAPWRDDSNVQYVSARFASAHLHGVSAALSYGAGASAARAGERAANRAWGLSVGVERGPWLLRAAYQNRDMDAVAPASAIGRAGEARNIIVAANLRLGQGTAYAAYSASRGRGSSPLWNPDNPYGAAIASTFSTDRRDVLVGLALPVGATTWLASFIRTNDRDLAKRNADQVAVGATYAFSQRTDFYAAYSRITNRDGAHDTGNACAPGGGSAALNLGLRHAF